MYRARHCWWTSEEITGFNDERMRAARSDQVEEKRGGVFSCSSGKAALYVIGTMAIEGGFMDVEGDRFTEKTWSLRHGRQAAARFTKGHRQS